MQAPHWFVKRRLLAVAGSIVASGWAFAVSAPTVITLSSLMLPEGSLPDALIGTLDATDPDPEDSHVFTLVSGAGDSANVYCRITDNQLRFIYGVIHDFESGPFEIPVRVRATDSAGLYVEKAFVVMISDSRTEDADGDGLTEAEEEDTYGTSDVAFDSDGDGVGDGVELAAGLSPTDAHLWPPTAVLAWGNNRARELAAPIGGGIVAMATGQRHSLSVNVAGLVSAWGGDNTYGQLAVPPDLQNVIAIAAGGDYWLKDSAHSVALKSDGTVVGWGYDCEGKIVVPDGLNQVVNVSAGRSHCLALKKNGTVVAWGYNPHDGQIQPPVGLNHVVAISAGGFHSLALKSDGTVVTWGNNFDGTTWGDAVVPMGLCDVVEISAGRFHNLALKRDGTVVAWGYNVDGQASVPAGLRNVVAISAGGFHSMALRCDGSVVTWGSNTLGQRSVPASAGSGVNIISAGIFHSLAVKQATGFPAITSNRFIQGEPGLPISHQIAVKNASPTAFSVIDLPAGLSIDSQTGLINGTSAATRSTVRVQVSTDQGVLSQNLWVGVATGSAPESISLSPSSLAENSGAGTVVGALTAIDPDVGDVDFTYQLVDGEGSADNARFHIQGSQFILNAPLDRDFEADSTPFTVRVRARDASLNPFEQILTIQFHDDRSEDADGDGLTEAQEEDLYQTNDLLVDTDGDGFTDRIEINRGTNPNSSASLPTGRIIVSWGANGNGECEPPAGLENNVVALAAGGLHSLALLNHGTVVAWGGNTEGQTDIPEELGSVCAISAGGRHSLALTQDGNVVAWGANDLGQCALPSGLSGVVEISAGKLHNLALKGDGTVVAWGFNGNGQCEVPSGLIDVVAVAAGGFHSLALKSDGTVVTWGSDWDGVSTVPQDLTGVVAIAAGGYHSLALKHDGSVVAWGSSAEGQISIPVGLADAKAIAAGWRHSVALKTDGTVVSWGHHGDSHVLPPHEAQDLRLIAVGESHHLAIRQATGFPGFANTSPLRAWPGESVFRLMGVQNATASSFSSMGMPDGLILDPLGGFVSGNVTVGQRRAVRIRAQTDQNTLSEVVWFNTADGVPPTDITLSGTTLMENCPSGSVVGTLSVTDPNSGDSHVLALLGGDSYRFALNGNQIVVSGPLTADYDAGLTQLFVRVKATDLGNNSLEKNFTLQLTDDRNEDADGDGFNEAFEEDVLGSSDAVAGDAKSSDTDKDGTPAMLEYAFNLNPKVANPPLCLTAGADSTAGLPAVTVVGGPANGRLRLEYIRRIGGFLTYTPQFATTLADWLNATETITVTPIDANWERCVVEDALGLPANEKRFARVMLNW